MTEQNTASRSDDTVETVETVVVEEVKPGILGRTFNKIKNHKVVTSMVIISGAAGAGYIAYTKLRDGADVDDVAGGLAKAAARLAII
jgi:hypothetical protein